MPFEVVVPEVDETFGPGPPFEEVRRVAERKGAAVVRDWIEATVIAADTVVEVAGRVLGKPRDREHAREMLRTLSGARQDVHTGVAVFSLGRLWRSHTETTRVVMRTITPAEIDSYVASGESMGKAGAYAIQENGDAFVAHLDGDFDNVVGLPVAWLSSQLTLLARS